MSNIFKRVQCGIMYQQIMLGGCKVVDLLFCSKLRFEIHLEMGLGLLCAEYMLMCMPKVGCRCWLQ